MRSRNLSRKNDQIHVQTSVVIKLNVYFRLQARNIHIIILCVCISIHKLRVHTRTHTRDKTSPRGKRVVYTYGPWRRRRGRPRALQRAQSTIRVARGRASAVGRRSFDGAFVPSRGRQCSQPLTPALSGGETTDATVEAPANQLCGVERPPPPTQLSGNASEETERAHRITCDGPRTRAATAARPALDDKPLYAS